MAGYHFPADYHDHYPVDCHGHYQTAEYHVADYNKCAEVGVGSPVLLPVHQDPSLWKHHHCRNHHHHHHDNWIPFQMAEAVLYLMVTMTWAIEPPLSSDYNSRTHHFVLNTVFKFCIKYGLHFLSNTVWKICIKYSWQVLYQIRFLQIGEK